MFLLYFIFYEFIKVASNLHLLLFGLPFYLFHRKLGNSIFFTRYICLKGWVSRYSFQKKRNVFCLVSLIAQFFLFMWSTPVLLPLFFCYLPALVFASSLSIIAPLLSMNKPVLFYNKYHPSIDEDGPTGWTSTSRTRSLTSISVYVRAISRSFPPENFNYEPSVCPIVVHTGAFLLFNKFFQKSFAIFDFVPIVQLWCFYGFNSALSPTNLLVKKCAPPRMKGKLARAHTHTHYKTIFWKITVKNN